MADPRDGIPDTVLTAPDGTRFLTRCPQLLIQAERDAAPCVFVDCALMLATSQPDQKNNVEVMPIALQRQGFTIEPADLPPELAVAVAAWMATQAAPLGQRILDRMYPAQRDAEPAGKL